MWQNTWTRRVLWVVLLFSQEWGGVARSVSAQLGDTRSDLAQWRAVLFALENVVNVGQGDFPDRMFNVPELVHFELKLPKKWPIFRKNTDILFWGPKSNQGVKLMVQGARSAEGGVRRSDAEWLGATRRHKEWLGAVKSSVFFAIENVVNVGQGDILYPS